jgi:hypothetical protein
MRVTLAAGRGSENTLQGRSTAIDFRWIATEASKPGRLRSMKGASKPKKGAKKQAQKSLKERRNEKKAAAQKKFSSGY